MIIETINIVGKGKVINFIPQDDNDIYTSGILSTKFDSSVTFNQVVDEPESNKLSMLAINCSNFIQTLIENL